MGLLVPHESRAWRQTRAEEKVFLSSTYSATGDQQSICEA